MTVSISKPVTDLRVALAKLAGVKPSPRRTTIQFEGNGSTTTFACTKGFKPTAVYVDGLRVELGVAGYSVTFDGFTYSVVLATAPSTVFILIDQEEVV